MPVLCNSWVRSGHQGRERHTPAEQRESIIFLRALQRHSQPSLSDSPYPLHFHGWYAMIIAPFPHQPLTPPCHTTLCRRTRTLATRPKTPWTLHSGLPFVWTCAQHSGRRHMHSGSVINRVAIVYHPPTISRHPHSIAIPLTACMVR